MFSSIVCLLFVSWVGLSLMFLFPYRRVLVHDDVLLNFMALTMALYANLVVGAYALTRAVSMRTTGTKLSAVDRGLSSGASISRELTETLRRE